MTRDEAKQDLHYSLQFDTLKPNLFIDKIYDEFENKSCNWYQQEDSYDFEADCGMNIPTYRAKSNERKNSYVEGLLIGVDEELNLCTIRTKDDYIGGEICYIHTLSIHFSDMLDSQGNKIFASLSEDGKGGDITELQASSGTCLSCGDKLPKILAVAIFEQMEFREIELNPHKCFRKRENNYMLIGNLKYKKVIGIQE